MIEEVCVLLREISVNPLEKVLSTAECRHNGSTAQGRWHGDKLRRYVVIRLYIHDICEYYVLT